MLFTSKLGQPGGTIDSVPMPRNSFILIAGRRIHMQINFCIKKKPHFFNDTVDIPLKEHTVSPPCPRAPCPRFHSRGFHRLQSEVGVLGFKGKT